MKEIIYPLGATIDVRAIKLGDATMSVLEIWGAEYQENDCLLIRPGDRSILEGVCARERCSMQVLIAGAGLSLCTVNSGGQSACDTLLVCEYGLLRFC